MALSADKTRTMRGLRQLAIRMANGVTGYGGGYAGLRGPNHGTSQGDADSFDDENGMIPLGGFLQRQKVGDTSASPAPEAEIGGVSGPDDRVLIEETVTGAAAQTDVGKMVYLTDDDTLTLTRPTLGIPIGVIVRWHTSTTCDVYLFDFGTLCAIALGGSGQDIWNLGTFDANTLAAGNIRTGIAAPYHGEFLEFYAIVDVALASSGDFADLNLEIGGTDVTGGVITLTAPVAKGVKVAGTAITAAAVFHEGDLIDIEVATSPFADLTAGSFTLYATVKRHLGV